MPFVETSRVSYLLNVCDKPALSQLLSLKGTEQKKKKEKKRNDG
jgi:hypothetical protein